MISERTTERCARWSADRFYWAVLDARAVGAARAGRVSTKRLGYLFESLLPGVPIEDVHAVYQRLPGRDGEYVACALPADVVSEQVDSGSVVLIPDAVPTFVGDRVDPAALNLLTGRFQPRPARRLRRWRALVALAWLAIVASLLVAGLERRVAAVRAGTGDIRGRQQDTFLRVLGPGALDPAPGAPPPEQRLIVERRRLEQTRRGDVGADEAVDCASILASLLAHWPDDVPVLTESIIVRPNLITHRARVPDMADTQTLVDALGSMSGWRVEQPLSEGRRDHVDVTLQFRRTTEP